VLARFVEVVSGVQFDIFLNDNILEPLGMHDTGHFVTGTDVARLTAHYEEQEDGSLKQRDQSTGHYTKKPTFFAGSTGLVSTSSDYFRFSQMLLNGGELNGVRILGPRTVAFMTQNHVSPETKRNFLLAAGHGFGLGFDVLLDNVKHGSPMSEGTYFWVGSAGCFFFIDPVEELVVIVMVQRTPQIVTTMKPEIEALVYQAIID